MVLLTGLIIALIDRTVYRGFLMERREERPDSLRRIVLRVNLGIVDSFVEERFDR